AFTLVKKYADKGYTNAALILADFYYKGIGTNPNKTESNKWFTISFYRDIDLKKSETIKTLLSTYYITEEIKISSTMRRMENERIKEYWAHYVVGKHLFYGTNGYPQDKVASCYWLKKPSRQHLPHADYLLYQLLKNTKFAPDAYRHLIASAEMTYSPAMKEAAIILLEEENHEDAYRLFKFAEKEGEDVEKYLQQTSPQFTQKQLRFLNRSIDSHSYKFLKFKKETSVLKLHTYDCLSAS
ncbi:MAG: hypothetical protein GY804_06970, partial [Alphaproteobacteria bacterium]|nr:hypothetical protein [Alphaproteobacteria bacterium]